MDSMKNPDIHDHYLTIRFSGQQLQEIKDHAERADLSVNDVVRYCIEDALPKMKGHFKFAEKYLAKT